MNTLSEDTGSLVPRLYLILVTLITRFFTGHSSLKYWRKKDSEKAEIFRKIEPYLIFLNVHQLKTGFWHSMKGRRIRATEPVNERS